MRFTAFGLPSFPSIYRTSATSQSVFQRPAETENSQHGIPQIPLSTQAEPAKFTIWFKRNQLPVRSGLFVIRMRDTGAEIRATFSTDDGRWRFTTGRILSRSRIDAWCGLTQEAYEADNANAKACWPRYLAEEVGHSPF